jgi:hypothetical protein
MENSEDLDINLTEKKPSKKKVAKKKAAKKKSAKKTSAAKPAKVKKEANKPFKPGIEQEEVLKGDSLIESLNASISNCVETKLLSLEAARKHYIALGELKEKVDSWYKEELSNVQGDIEQVNDIRQILTSINMNHRLASGIMASTDKMRDLSDYQLITDS